MNVSRRSFLSRVAAAFAGVFICKKAPRLTLESGIVGWSEAAHAEGHCFLKHEGMMTALLDFFPTLPERYKRRIQWREYEPDSEGISHGRFVALHTGDETPWREAVLKRYPHLS